MEIKEIVVISGKGGTGKTTLTASLIPYLENPVVADCDVDAPDLHILLSPDRKNRELFMGGYKAFIDSALCSSCGRCREACRFDAVSGQFLVTVHKCEGCGVCEYVCPKGAASLKATTAGELYSSQTAWGPFIHARLYPGEETSGKLVSLVRKRAREKALETGRNIILVDGSPGIGCNVISSLTGASLAILVTEPTESGLHDLERVHALTGRLSVPAVVVINKWDLSPGLSEKVETFCKDHNLPLLMKLPFDSLIVKAVGQKKIPSQLNPTFFQNSGMGKLINRILL